MVKLFLSNRAIVIFLLPFIIGAYLALGFYNQQFIASETINLGFFGVFTLDPIFTTVLSFVLVFSNAFIINHLFNKNEFYDRNTYLPSLLYVVFMSYYHSFYKMDGVLIAHTLLILCLRQLFMLKQNEDGRKIIFNAAFLGGLAAIVHPPFVVLLPFLFIMVWAIRPFVLRESLLLITGFGVPLIYGGFYLKWVDSSINLQLLKQATFYENQLINYYVTTGIMAIMLLLGFIGIQSKMSKSSIRLKKIVRILWILLLLSILFGVGDFLIFHQIERFSFIVISLCFFLPYTFIHKTWAPIASGIFYLAFIYSFIKFFI